MGKKQKSEPHPHSQCKHSKLIQYSNDPVIAECDIDSECHVASTLVTCPFFKQCSEKKEIEHRKKRLGITNIYI